MRVRHLLFASMMVLGLVAVTSPANAAVVDWTVQVNVNTNDQGTITSTGGTLIVNVTLNDTVRFTIGLTNTNNLTSYQSVVIGDITEMSYQDAGTGAQDSNLSGGSMNFAALSDPDAQLQDASPAVGNIQSVGGTLAGLSMYFVEYVVGAVNSDGSIDFSLSGSITSAGGVDSASTGTASVRLDSTAPPVPEPASMLLLGSGLAGLVGFGRKKFRK